MPIDKLIINSPYDVPKRYWKFNNSNNDFEIIEGRRPAGYHISKILDLNSSDPGEFIENNQVNLIRKRVDEWRRNNYPNVTSVTKKLLEQWNSSKNNKSHNSFFYCQIEAIETLIWLTESSLSEKTGIKIKSDGGDFERWCTKMATGTGKTVVMAMLIAWNILNKVAYPKDTRFSKNILIITPNITIKKRLRVLNPSSEINYYEDFNIVLGEYMPLLRKGKVFITNWHPLNWETQSELNNKFNNKKINKSVDKRKYIEISNTAYLKKIFGNNFSIKDIIVINDEAHHAWRMPNQEFEVSKEDYQEFIEYENNATVWMKGLDRINKNIKILKCFDLSATPFIPFIRRNEEEALFSWIVSDFGLNDSIESGLVKTPTVAKKDKQYYHIYDNEEVKNNLKDKTPLEVPLPKLVKNAYFFLMDSWIETKDIWIKNKISYPPVMITIANYINTSDRIFNAIMDNNSELNGYFDDDKVIKVDSKSLKKDEKNDIESELRQKVNSVGKIGKPGQFVQHIISVEMLNEGWDANNVTHILGLRAFSSQLLCEQIIGRGLRRSNYEIGSDGLLEPEYVSILGIPFTYLPQEGGTNPKPAKPQFLVSVVPDKYKHEITWPNIERIECFYKSKLEINWKNIQQLKIELSEFISELDLHAIIEGKQHKYITETLGLKKIEKNTRLQTIIYKIAARIYHENKNDGWNGREIDLITQLVNIVDIFIKSGKIVINNHMINNNFEYQKIIYMLNMENIIQHLWQEIKFNNVETYKAIFNNEISVISTGNMRSWYTSKISYLTNKSHINRCVGDSGWEIDVAKCLEKSNYVESYVKNDTHVGFIIDYKFEGVMRKYIPDFLIKFENQVNLILEVKGKKIPKDDTKLHYMNSWVKAVNNEEIFGKWHWDIIYDPADINKIIDKYTNKEN